MHNPRLGHFCYAAFAWVRGCHARLATILGEIEGSAGKLGRKRTGAGIKRGGLSGVIARRGNAYMNAKND